VSFLLVEQLAGRSFDPPLGPTGYHRLLSPYRKPYRTRDGYLAIIPYTGAHWLRFLDLIGRSDLASDPRVTDSVQRSHHIDMLYALIEQAAPSRTTAEWLAELRVRDIPCAEVNRMDDLLEHPHLADVGMFRHVEHPEEGPIVSVRSPFRGEGESDDLLARELGADTREVLAEAGLDAQTIATLIASGVAAAG
jgi:crotonobetainyl-CoA:carnitine CoA-transferase CaiB-like acyl-CoA transferase